MRRRATPCLLRKERTAAATNANQFAVFLYRKRKVKTRTKKSVKKFPLLLCARRREEMFQYSDTLEFDLVVILFVVAVMPLSVFLMQSRSKTARAASFALLFLAVFYVAGRGEGLVGLTSCVASV